MLYSLGATATTLAVGANVSEEESIDRIENLVPSLSATAINSAYTDAINHGLSVYVCDFNEEAIIEILPSGIRRVIKKINKPMKVTPGTTYEIK